MIVVSDTTPLRHLIMIGRVDLLWMLYESVTVPTAVWKELQAESTPAAVRTWLERAPDWLNIRSPRRPAPANLALGTLDAGEREAIQLAIELEADLLLMDDRDARALALRLLWQISKSVASTCPLGCGRPPWNDIEVVTRRACERRW